LLPIKSCDQPSYSQDKAYVTLFDLAPGGVYHAFFVTKKAVSSYLTFSPLPYKFQLGRFIFCGTFPEVALAGN
tara:strand:- start:2176 stop:2394 length:219 start_codon:yes stop_codon:yes gene_type:complete